MVAITSAQPLLLGWAQSVHWWFCSAAFQIHFLWIKAAMLILDSETSSGRRDGVSFRDGLCHFLPLSQPECWRGPFAGLWCSGLSNACIVKCFWEQRGNIKYMQPCSWWLFVSQQCSKLCAGITGMLAVAHPMSWGPEWSGSACPVPCAVGPRPALCWVASIAPGMCLFSFSLLWC